MKVVICNVSIGGWYPKGAARMIQEFDRVSPGFEIQSYVNTLPFGAPASVIEDGYDYTAYCAKPFALAAARASGADIAILLDSAFFPVRAIHPLLDHISRHGYYFCKNGALVGNWSSDRALERMGWTRDNAMQVEEVSSYCVGLNFSDGRATEVLRQWVGFAADRLTFAGPHSNAYENPTGRNASYMSADLRCKGHRHDQTALSLIAHRMGMHEIVERPKFTAYDGSQTEETVLVNRGM